MRNLIKRISALLLCLLLVLSLPVTALAEEARDTDEAAAAEEGTTLRILRQKQFLDFTENCRLEIVTEYLLLGIVGYHEEAVVTAHQLDVIPRQPVCPIQGLALRMAHHLLTQCHCLGKR